MVVEGHSGGSGGVVGHGSVGCQSGGSGGDSDGGVDPGFLNFECVWTTIYNQEFSRTTL